MKKTSYPRFTPTRTYKHDILGRVSVYEIKNPFLLSDENGCQTDFFTNHAEVGNRKQFGIKLFRTSIEAFGAFERQSIAAKKGFAPPVGTMIQWKCGRWSRWGYQTCLADCCIEAQLVARVLCHDEALELYDAWKNHPLSGAVGTLENNINEFLRDGSMNLMYTKEYKRKDESLLNRDWRISYETGSWMPRYNIEHLYTDSSKSKLRLGLRSISCTGLQYDNLWELHDDGNYSFARNRRLMLGKKWKRKDRCTLGGDLHTANVGLWNGKPVCIDFGFHCVVNPLYAETFESDGAMIGCPSRF